MQQIAPVRREGLGDSAGDGCGHSRYFFSLWHASTCGYDGSRDSGGRDRSIEREPRVNEKIRAREVRVIGPNGEQLGIMGVRDALVKAAEAELDLVEVAPTSVPPVCRIIDYGKYKYEQQKKSRGSHRRTSDIKGMRFSPKIGEHDFQVKARHVYEFLHEGNKVRASVWFRGREMAYPRAGEHLLARLADIVANVGIVERPPLMEGRNMIMILTPKKG